MPIFLPNSCDFLDGISENFNKNKLGTYVEFYLLFAWVDKLYIAARVFKKTKYLQFDWSSYFEGPHLDIAQQKL